MAKNVVGIIQARMGSQRFPGKVLADIAGHPMIWHVVNRTQHANSIHMIVVATSLDIQDDPIADFCFQNAIICFRGNTEDVLDRYYQAAKEYGADVIVRLTADCPLLDTNVIDKVVSTYLKNNFDYVSNVLQYTYPDGLDTEVFSFAALERGWKEAKSPSEREHVTPFIKKSGLFCLKNVESGIPTSAARLRWTVDDPKDLEFVRAVYASLGSKGEQAGLEEVLEVLRREPRLMMINQNTIRNEGAYKTLLKEAPVPAQKRSLKRSLELKERASKYIPSLSQTFSKGPTQYVQGVAPVFLEKGLGSHVWDVDGNEYIDYPMALGPILLGHNDPVVNEAVRKQMEKGNVFSLPHPLEVEMAELLTGIIPCAEMVRFGKNGSDVTAGAVRAARAFTGRDLIACCGYHGWQDWYIGTTTRNGGVPKEVRKLTLPFAYNDIAGLDKIFSGNPKKVAAVILEPFISDEPQDRFLEKVAALAKREGAILIFDEMVTGFRLSLGGAQEYFGVVPDLSCFGKGMANGYPLSAVVGKREIMEIFDEIFFSFTFGGETLSLAAAKATIKQIRDKNVIGHLWAQGQRLRDGYNVLAKEFGIHQNTQATGLPPRVVMTFKENNGSDSMIYKSLFQQECLKRGILFTGGQNICFSHSPADIDYTLRVYRTAMEILASAIVNFDAAQKLEGEIIRPVFRKV